MLTHFRLFAAVLVAALSWSPSAYAVVVAGNYANTSDQNVNLGPPSNFPYFYNVGSVGIASDIYLGNNWVLTASHVQLGSTTSFSFPDPSNPQNIVTGTYNLVPNSGIGLTNTSGAGAGQNTDMVMFKIDPTSSPYGAPNLPQLPIAPNSPSVGSLVIGIGRGYDRGDTQTTWDSNWTTPPQGPVAHTGYINTGPETMRWGDNQVSVSPVTYNVGTQQSPVYLHAFTTTFDQFTPSGGGTATANEFSASYGDSGGATFIQLGNAWYLNGMIDAVDTLSGQPWPGTEVFTSKTVIADLSQYMSQILTNNPVVGDVNHDGIVNGLDISQIAAYWLTTSPLGDANGDGIVNGLDIAVVASHWLSPTINSGGGGGSGTNTVAPEPSAGALAGIAIAVLSVVYGRRRLRPRAAA